MKIAIPTMDGRLCEQFAACRHFTLTELDDSHQLCRTSTLLRAPNGGIGETVDWLAAQGVTMVVAGAMDVSTEHALCAAGIQLLLGAPGYQVPAVVARYLMGQLC